MKTEAKPQYKIYRDSKELPLRIYERIDTTGDFFYMIKGYELGDEVDGEQTYYEEEYKNVVQEFVLSINSKNFNSLNIGEAFKSNEELCKLTVIVEIIELQQLRNKCLLSVGKEVNDSIIKDILSQLKIQKSEDLEIQKNILKTRIEKLKNDLEESQNKIEKTQEGDESDETNILQKVVDVELILERTIDLDKTMLYQFGLLIEMAMNKIKSLNKK